MKDDSAGCWDSPFSRALDERADEAARKRDAFHNRKWVSIAEWHEAKHGRKAEPLQTLANLGFDELKARW